MSSGAAQTNVRVVADDSGGSSSAVVAPAATGTGGEAGGIIRAAENVSHHRNDFRLLYVPQFLTEAGNGITERILNGSYDQFIGYIRGRIDQ